MDANEWPCWTDEERWEPGEEDAAWWMGETDDDDQDDGPLDERAAISAFMDAYERGMM